MSHELRGQCQRVPGLACDPGMKGCVLFGRFTFSIGAKNRPPRRAHRPTNAPGRRPPGGEKP